MEPFLQDKQEESAWILGLVAFPGLRQVVQGKVEAGQYHTHKRDTDKSYEDGKQFHTKTSEEMAAKLRDITDILDPVLKV